MRNMKLALISYVFLTVLAITFASCDGARIDWQALPQIQSAAFNNTDKLWFVTARSRRLMRTEDGGMTWSEIPTGIGGITQISFIDQKRGWSVNKDGAVFRTVDGGNTWTRTAQLRNGDSRFYTPLQIQFVDELHGWVRETYSIFRTQDGGVTWGISFPPKNGEPFKGQPGAMQFIDSENGWVCGEEGEIYHTRDGGQSWDQELLSRETTCSDVFFLDQNTGWASAWPDAGIYRTNDAGKSWRLQLKATRDNDLGIDSVHFIDKHNGWAVGLVWPKRIGREPTRGLVLRTTNGGETWAVVQVGENETFFSRVHFSDVQHGWVFSRDNVYRTQDAGKTWRTVLKLPPIKTAS